MSYALHSRRIAELSELGWSRDAIAAELGVSTMFVFRSLKMLAELPRRQEELPKPVESRITKRQRLLERSKLIRTQHEANRVLKAEQAAAVARRRAENDTRGCPTPEEIAERSAEVRATWTSRERLYRLPRSARWTVPELCCVDYCEG